MTPLDEYRSLSRDVAAMPFMEWASRFSATARDRDPWRDGSFRLHPAGCDWDLYGLVDMLLCAVTLEPSHPAIGRMDTGAWVERILSCLDTDGMATRRNPTDHVPEHATAYAYTGLVLLRNRGARVVPPPLRYFASPTFSRAEFEAWFRRMGLQCPRWFPGEGLRGSVRRSARRLGWYRFWSGSHVGGGVMATLVMRSQLSDPEGRLPRVDKVPELVAFFDLANHALESRTGLWRPWIKRILSRRPDISDVGGAAHFLWLYDRLGVRHPRAEAMLAGALELQRDDGLFSNEPGCLDLDFAHLFSYAARLGVREDLHHVDDAMLRNGIAVLGRLLGHGGLEGYVESHRLPGALCAVAQVDAYLRWRGLESGPSPTRDVLSEVCWI